MNDHKEENNVHTVSAFPYTHEQLRELSFKERIRVMAEWNGNHDEDVNLSEMKGDMRLPT
jgi:hypothetical protein